MSAPSDKRIRFGPETGRPMNDPPGSGVLVTPLQIPLSMGVSPEAQIARHGQAPFMLDQPVLIVALEFAPQAVMEEHSMPFPVMLFVTAGRGQMRLGPPDAPAHPLRAGDAVLCPADAPRTVWTDGETMQMLAVEYVPGKPKD
ncbi:MAG TPA: hypothetical protein VFS21_34610 [Roseiflexaceae bacterium]|nr:hypothetical protein [Roseiflexaceae bacterium]